MELYVQLYIFINLFCALVLLAYALHSRIGMGNTTLRRYFVAINITIIVFFLSDAIWLAMNQGLVPQVWWIGTLLNNVYFLSVTFAGYLWFLFLLALAHSKTFSQKKNIRLALIPALIHVLLCIYNYFNPIFFGIDQNFEYFRGPLFAVQYLFYYLYTIPVSIYAIIKALRPENYIERGHYLLVAVFPIMPVMSGTLQLFYPQIPFNCLAFTLALTIVYMNELGQQISQEPLTHLANRKQFMRTLEQAMAQSDTNQQLYLFMMDIDKFKSINDTYGHYEGDQALIMVSDALKRAVSRLHQRATLARYAGDEFAIIAYFDTPEEAHQFKDAIQRELNTQSNSIDKGYELSMSIGIAQYSPEMKTLRNLLEAADAQLYVEKRNRRQ